MHIGGPEWQQLQARQPAASPGSIDLPTTHPLAGLYRRLAEGMPDEATREQGAAFVRAEIELLKNEPADLPATPDGLLEWMEANTQSVHTRYAAYLEERRAGAPRRYFTNRAHALYVLRSVAPTKLVDGSWLYGLVRHWRSPRLADLVRTYVEELGEGAIDKNHVVLYRQLLARYALDPLDDLDDALYRQGLVQVALGWNAEQFLPEIVGFNLAYEQLPLHLLITAYELNELGLDPYYFTLHVTVDNSDSGHARRACQAVLDLLPRLDDGGAFWRRVQDGARLSNTGVGTTAVIEGFDIDAEVVRILRHKSRAGSGAHSDYCRVAGKRVNEWLASPDDLPAFLAALTDAGWIKRGEPPENSRFWQLLQGERAEMFGVFSSYELQVIHDWIRGEASADGQAYVEVAPPEGKRRRATFRAALRNGLVASAPVVEPDELLDADFALLREGLEKAKDDDEARMALLVSAMAPSAHWTPAGLEATKLFWRQLTN
jgi:hypothetical protein